MIGYCISIATDSSTPKELLSRLSYQSAAHRFTGDYKYLLKMGEFGCNDDSIPERIFKVKNCDLWFYGDEEFGILGLATVKEQALDDILALAITFVDNGVDLPAFDLLKNAIILYNNQT